MPLIGPGSTGSSCASRLRRDCSRRGPWIAARARCSRRSSCLAIRLARHNAVLNAVEGVKIEQSDALRDTRETDFTWILCNPPYHADFAVPREMIEKGFNRLRVGGHIALVTRRRTWYEKKLGSIFGGAEVHEVDGYFVLKAQKRRKDYARRRR